MHDEFDALNSHLKILELLDRPTLANITRRKILAHPTTLPIVDLTFLPFDLDF
jgi:hypothetical protein